MKRVRSFLNFSEKSLPTIEQINTLQRIMGVPHIYLNRVRPYVEFSTTVRCSLIVDRKVSKLDPEILGTYTNFAYLGNLYQTWLKM